ncbi:nuclear transport factor 2 family protein [Streptomyces pactum]|nr:nuclear transport factor 2 family protein [Streptomyces pactum]
MNESNGPVAVVERQLHAYNTHDLDAFVGTYAPDITPPSSRVMVG